MSSSIKLTNANGKILTITNPDSLTGDSHMNPTTTAYTIETVDDFGSVPSGYTTVIVKDSNRGGTFTWSSTGTSNGGTVFAGSSGYWVRQYSGAVNVDWFGAKGDAVLDINTNAYTGTDNYSIIQDLLILAKTNQWNIEFSNKKYLISQGLILPFGNYQTITSNKIIGNGATFVSNISLSSLTSSSITAISTGYIDINGNLQISTGTEEHLTSNIVIENLNFSHFGKAIYGYNMIFGSALRDINVYNCFNGIDLLRCFYLVIDNIFVNGINKKAESIGFSTRGFSNVIENRGIKCRGFDIGILIGNTDGCKFTTISAEGNNYGIVIGYECSLIEIDTAYLEGNFISNLDIRAVVRNGTITNSWFYGDNTKQITTTLDSNSYANINLINNLFYSGLSALTPLYNIYGKVAMLSMPDTKNDLNISNFPNLIIESYDYNIDSVATGYNTPTYCIKKFTSGQNLVPTYFNGSHIKGINPSERAFNQSFVITNGQCIFDTDFDYIVTSIISWSVSIAHYSGIITGNYLLIPEANGLDITSCNFKAYYSNSTSGILSYSSFFTVSNNNGKIRVTCNSLTTPSLYHSYMRLI